jgi:phage terminase large subunit-like protein
MPRSKTAHSTPTQSEPKLSEVARHIVMPEGIVTTAWPRVVAKCKDMGVTFDSWQHGVGAIALGKRKDGKYAATVGGVVLSIPRQVGKTFLVGMIIIALCVLFPGFTVLWTAHRTRTATMTFESMQGMVKRKKIRPHLAPGRNDGIRTSNGQQEIRFKNGSVIMFGAREDGFGRGFDQVDIEVFDEAQILTEKALEDMVPAANQSQHPGGALLFFMGTPPRPVDRGDEFSNRRQKALSGKGKNSAYIEFSADADADSDDREQWAKANPSYPRRTPDESMERMREQLTDDDSFRREALGIWDPNTTPQVIDPQSWDAVKDAGSMPTERLTIALDVAPDRKLATASLAGKRPDGLWHIEMYEQRAGVDWIPSWLTERAKHNKLHAVVADEMSGLVEKRKNGRWYVTGTDVVVTLASAEGRDMAVACAAVFDGVMAKTLRHTDQPQMNVALSVARKRPLAGAWAWNRKDPVSDITPIVSASLALWGAQNQNVKRQRSTQQREMVVI